MCFLQGFCTGHKIPPKLHQICLKFHQTSKILWNLNNSMAQLEHSIFQKCEICILRVVSVPSSGQFEMRFPYGETFSEAIHHCSADQ